MAFQFIPNEDGSFTEGDKQINPETGVEYIFTDGAWRPLGINNVSTGAVPVGSIMMWLSEEIPDGWFKCTGKYFGAADYPKLAAYLANTTGNMYGYLPNFEGHYPGGLGGGIGGGLGNKLRFWTAKPTNAPKSSKTMPDGSTGTNFVQSNQSGPPLPDNAYKVGKAAVTIDSGWDEVTRPNTFSVHFIIKHD